MIEKVYWLDAYKRELDAKVTSKIGNTIELDKTIFYSTGGGQPCDTGTVSINDNTYNVIEVKNVDNSIRHILNVEPELNEGDEVHCKIDWSKRYAYMRYHTATHVVGGLATTKHGAMFTGGQIYTDRARFDFDLQSLNRTVALELIEESQAVIDQNLDVVAKILSKEEALKMPDLARTEPGRELIKNMETIRVVEIVGFDMQLDGGTHVANTRELGKLELSGFENKGTRRKRIEIVLK